MRCLWVLFRILLRRREVGVVKVLYAWMMGLEDGVFVDFGDREEGR